MRPSDTATAAPWKPSPTQPLRSGREMHSQCSTKRSRGVGHRAVFHQCEDPDRRDCAGLEGAISSPLGRRFGHRIHGLGPAVPPGTTRGEDAGRHRHGHQPDAMGRAAGRSTSLRIDPGASRARGQQRMGGQFAGPRCPNRTQHRLGQPAPPKMALPTTVHHDRGYVYAREVDGRVLIGGGRHWDMRQRRRTAERLCPGLKRTFTAPQTCRLNTDGWDIWAWARKRASH